MPLLAYSQSQLLHHIHIHNPRVICDDENDQAARVPGCKEMEVIGERKKKVDPDNRDDDRRSEGPEDSKKKIKLPL